MRKLTHEELLERQAKLRKSEAKIPLVVVLNNIRSLYNVGSIFRTCDGIGVKQLWLCGITGKPPHARISKTALGAEGTVDWQYSWELIPVVKDLKQKGFQIVLLEQIEQSISYDEFIPAGPTCLVVGNEISGVSEELLELCDEAIEIEMIGLKNSLNVTVAFGIAAYHLRNCLKQVVPKG